MVVFGVITNLSDTAIKYVGNVNKKLSISNYIQNPFIGTVKTLLIKDKEHLRNLHIVSIKSMYPNFSIFSWPIAIIILITFGFNWAFYLAFLLSLLGFFWTKYFYIWVFNKGLRKAGYHLPIKVVNSNYIIEKLYLKEAVKWAN